MGNFVEFDSGAGTTRAYLSGRPGKISPASCFVMHGGGSTDFFTGLADRIAAEGFTVLAPDLYRERTAATIPEAEASQTP